jgi:hypothetical protein
VTFNANGTTKSDMWTFSTTIGSSPDVPTNPNPVDGSDQAVDNILLQWTGSDADQDTVFYDVYFGRDANPPLASAGLTRNQLEEPLDQLGMYYWRVVARDRYDLITEGPTWSFRAVVIPGYMYYWAGTGVAGGGAMGQPPLQTQLYWPVDISFSPDDALFVADWNNDRVIATDASGNFKLIAGITGAPGDPCLFAPPGCQDLVAANSLLNQPSHVAFDVNGNILVSAWHGSELFLIDKNTGLMDRVAGAGTGYTPDGQSVDVTTIRLASCAAYNHDGRLCYTDQENMLIRVVDESGIVHTVAGSPPIWDPIANTYLKQEGGYAGDEGPATSALFRFERDQFAMPSGKFCFDAAGNMYIADTMNHCVRMVDPSGIIHLFAGHPPYPGYGGNGHPANLYVVFLNEPRDVAVDTDGSVYIADTGNNVIRKVSSDGIISTVAGTRYIVEGSEKDGRPATASKLDQPFGIEIDAHGNLWIADTRNSRVRVVYR